MSVMAVDTLYVIILILIICVAVSGFDVKKPLKILVNNKLDYFI